ncbi:MAG: methyltransferase domain-containing protein, partial [Proteobacteria bacterium]|nr:methyltransferase domain-containing protein [Pseudomonadota bacterium]
KHRFPVLKSRPTEPGGPGANSEFDGLDLSAMVAIRSQLLLWLEEERLLWLPLPHIRTAGGYGYASRQLTHCEWRVFEQINDRRSVSAIARRSGLPEAEVIDFLTTMTSIDVQAVQLRATAPARWDPSLRRLVSLPRPGGERPSNQYGADGETALTEYHLHDIVDGSRHFDDRETTVAHVLALPHQALAGQVFGQRLCSRLAPGEGSAVLEIGGGDGELAEAWNRSWQGRYFRVDLSPELLKTQGERVPGSMGVLADCTALPFGNDSFDLVVCNEVIADLAAVPLGGAGPTVTLARERVARYGLPVSPVYNLGAILLLEELARVLKPGGRAWVSEFGDLDQDPQEAEFLDHPEVSIHFGHLAHVARQLGFEVQCLPMAEFLDVDLHAVQLARHSYEALRALSRSRSHHLPARAYAPDSLQAQLPFRVGGLCWVPLSDKGPGPLITRFWALVLHRRHRDR